MHPPSGLSPSESSSIGHPEHTIQFYPNDTFLIDQVEKRLRGAVESGDGAICVATKDHLGALAERWKMRDDGITTATEQGRFLSMDVADVLSAVMSNGSLDEDLASELFGSTLTKITATIVHGEPRIVTCGETVAVLWEEGKVDDVLRLEQLWNRLGRVNPVSVFCAYPTQAFRHPQDTEYFWSICGEHSAVIALKATRHRAVPRKRSETRFRRISCWTRSGTWLRPKLRSSTRNGNGHIEPRCWRQTALIYSKKSRLHRLRF